MSSSFKQQALDYHRLPTPGKLGTKITKPTESMEDLSKGYTPGVGYPVEEIHQDPNQAYNYTNKGNLVGVITNGTAVLGMGNVGPLASKPVMEGKGVLFKKMAGLDVFDIEVNESDPKKFVEVVAAIAPTFGAINLEDIRSPDCFYIEDTLRKKLNIPVFHDDQHGTAIVVAAGMLNALKVQDILLDNAKIVVLGAGAAGIAVTNILLSLGANRKNVFMSDRTGILHKERNLPDYKKAYAQDHAVSFSSAMKDADIFIGLASPNALDAKHLALMQDKSIIFALSNPVPDVDPQAVKELKPQALFATGRSDLPNQINNVLAFPYILKAALELKIPQITPQMIAKCAEHLASLVTDPSLTNIVPGAFDPRLVDAFRQALSDA